MKTFWILTGISASVLIFFVFLAASFIGHVTDIRALGVLVFLLLLGAIFLQGFPEIPNNPLRKGIATFLGWYIDKGSGGVSLSEGRHLLLLYGLLFDYVPYDATRRTLKFSITERTPDDGVITMEIELVYEIDSKHPYWFIEAGKLEGVTGKLIAQIQTRIREWIRSPFEGPLKWQEASGLNGLATYVIVGKLFPKNLPIFPAAVIAAIPGAAGIPISLFIKYFTQQPPLSTDKKLHKDEVAAQILLDQLEVNDLAAWKDLKAAVLVQTNFINDVKSGYCALEMPNLGIIISRIGVGDIQADGKTAEAANRVSEQQLQNDVNNLKTKNQAARVEVLKKTGLTEQEALEAIQLQDGNATKKIEQKTFGVPPGNLKDALDFVRAVLPNRGGPPRP
jgi:hypothetical protein